MAMVFTLLRVNVEYLLLVFWQVGFITEDFLTRDGGSNDGRNIESLLTLGFADGCTEIAEGGYRGTAAGDDFRGKVVFLCYFQFDVFQQLLECVLVNPLVISIIIITF